jgi:leucyl/phenylalanyl-tRNA--protein transferase
MSVVAIGGDLTPQTLLDNYKKGIFPWPDDTGQLLWHFPESRMLLEPSQFFISKSLQRRLKKRNYQIKIDRNFSTVMNKCAKGFRKDRQETWITKDIKNAYQELHQLGYAHSVEVFQEQEIIGGLYGVAIGKYFSGESMFYTKTDGSKIAMFFLSQLLSKRKYHFIDCQVYTKHLESLGAELFDVEEFLLRLKLALKNTTDQCNWSIYEKNLCYP